MRGQLLNRLLPFRAIANFVDLVDIASASKVEVRKVVWPSTQETWQVTLVVFVMIVVLGLFFWGVDTLLGFHTKWLTGRGG